MSKYHLCQCGHQRTTHSGVGDEPCRIDDCPCKGFVLLGRVDQPKIMVEVDPALVPEGYGSPRIVGIVEPSEANEIVIGVLFVRPERKRQFVVEECDRQIEVGCIFLNGHGTDQIPIYIRIVREIQPDEQILTMKRVPPSGPRPISDYDA